MERMGQVSRLLSVIYLLFRLTNVIIASSICPICSKALFLPGVDTSPLVLIYLCGHAVHSTCALPDGVDLPDRPDTLASFLFSSMMANGQPGSQGANKALGAKLAYAATVRVRVRGCPVCRKQSGKGSHVMG